MPAMDRRRRTPIRILSSMLLLPLLLLAVSAASAAADEQDARGADRRALLEFKSAISADPAGLLTRWVGPDHCLWPGVSCAAARVVSLNLSAAAPCASPRLRCPDPRRRLTGTLVPALAELSELRSLSLPFHRFHGEIPREIWRMRSLEALDLEGSSLSGTLPFQFPVRLAALNLEGNRIAGEIPRHLANVVDSPPESPPSSSGKSWFNSVEIVSITSAAVIISVLVVLSLIYIYTRKCDPRSSSRSPVRRELITFVDVGVPLTYESVVRAAGGFSASNCIGNGGFGTIYKAEVSPGVVLAIKRLSIRRFHGIQQFHAEIKTLGRWRHPNLVTLIGYHLSDAEIFLIYNYLPGGNLERFIKQRSRPAIDWRILHKIALDVARALAYLHDHCVPGILHRDVKPSNILLDNDYNAYLSDFGLARLMGDAEIHVIAAAAGTFGYVAPEHALHCHSFDKTDVYSYGVVLLELISDKTALDPSFSPYGNVCNIVTWANMLLREGRAHDIFNRDLWEGGLHDDLAETLNLAIQCTHDSLSARPTMRQVIRRLKQLQPPTF